MNEQLSKFIKNPKLIPGAIGFVSFGVGIGLGYYLGARKQPIIYNTSDWPENGVFDTQAAISEMKEKETKLVVPDHVEIVEQGTDNHKADEIPDEITSEADFAQSTDDWDYPSELENRSPDRPHVLHKDEFFAEETEYTQSTLTYYVGDNILSDEDGVPIYNFEATTGPLLFGHGSDDPNVVYVRNDKLKGEYEINRDEGHYAVEVRGLEMEEEAEETDLKHSSSPHKFRDTD